MSETATVDVIIPTYNRLEVLPRAIESVKAQSYPHWRLWIVDDGSTDGSKDWIHHNLAKELGKGKINYLQSSHKGVSAARNLALKESSHSWVAFLDSDDQWHPEKLKKQLSLAERSNAPLIHSDEIWVRRGQRVNPMKKHKKRGGRIFKHCVPLCCMSPSTTLLRRRLFDKVGYFREDFPVCEDYDLWLKITRFFEVGFVPEKLITKYGGHDDQLSRQYKAMDYWRVKAMMDHLDAPELTEEEHNTLLRVAQKKCKILIGGYIKHNNPDSIPEVSAWLNRIQKRLGHQIRRDFLF